MTITLLGADENSEPHHLTDPKKCVFERGEVNTFLLTTPFSLGDLQGIRLWHNNSGKHPAWWANITMSESPKTKPSLEYICCVMMSLLMQLFWVRTCAVMTFYWLTLAFLRYVGNVVVQDTQTNQKWHFLCNSWLAINMGDCTLDKVFPVSTETDLKRFR